MNSRRHWAFVVFFIGLMGCTAAPTEAFRTQDVKGVSWGQDFELTDHRGQRLRSADLQGKFQVLFFGYTHCPDICSPTLARLATVLDKLGPDAERIQVLFVTVDPQHDTPEQLAGFLSKFDARFTGLTGSAAEIAAVAADFKVSAHAQTGGDAPRVDHSGGVFVKDTTGRMRLYMRDGVSADDIAHDLRLLIRQAG